MQCRGCGYEPTMSEQLASPERCPRCNRNYAKMEALRLAKDARIKAATDRRAEERKAGRFYCPSCGAVNNGHRHVPGSTLVELLMWVCFLLPGLIYSAWRLSSAKKACNVCNATELIPVDSPRARRELGRK